MRPRSASGFTLLEILVALAVFGFLLVGLSQTVRFGLTAWRQDARMSDGKTDLEAVDRSLRSIVENLAPADDAARPSIDGSADTLTGLTRLRLPGSNLAPVRVEAGLGVAGTRLVLRWRPYRHSEPFQPLPPAAETELLNGVASLRIAYWQRTGVWGVGWHEPDLPLLIRFRVIFAGEDAPRWPDIIVAPLLSRAMTRRQQGVRALIVLWTVGFLALLGTQIVAAGRSDTQLADNLKQEAVLAAAVDGAVADVMFQMLAARDPRFQADGVVREARVGRDGGSGPDRERKRPGQPQHGFGCLAARPDRPGRRTVGHSRSDRCRCTRLANRGRHSAAGGSQSGRVQRRGARIWTPWCAVSERRGTGGCARHDA